MKPLSRFIRSTSSKWLQPWVFWGRHRAAYSHFRRLLKDEEVGGEVGLYHYCAAAASNSGFYAEAQRYWRLAAKLDPESAVPQILFGAATAVSGEGKSLPQVSCHNYQLPFQEQLKLWKDNKGSFTEELSNNPLIRSSFFWALRYGGR